MKIYAIADKTNRLAFYLDNGLVTIPTKAFEVSEEEWFQCMQYPSKYTVENNALKIASNWIEPVVVEPLPIIDKRAIVVSSLQSATTILQLKLALITYFNNT